MRQAVLKHDTCYGHRVYPAAAIAIAVADADAIAVADVVQVTVTVTANATVAVTVNSPELKTTLRRGPRVRTVGGIRFRHDTVLPIVIYGSSIFSLGF